MSAQVPLLYLESPCFKNIRHLFLFIFFKSLLNPIEKHTTSKYITLKMLYVLQEEATDRVGVVGDLEALCGEVREGFSDV